MGFGEEFGLSSERNGKLLGLCAADRHGFKSSFWRGKKDLPAVVRRAVCIVMGPEMAAGGTEKPHARRVGGEKTLVPDSEGRAGWICWMADVASERRKPRVTLRCFI